MILLPLIAAAMAATIDIPACDTLTITSQTQDQVTLACGHNPPPPVGAIKEVLVVPVRYGSAPSTDPLAVKAYNDTLPAVTQIVQQAVWAPIAVWWGVETYGKQQMHVTVLPAINVPGNPVCDSSKIRSDVNTAIAGMSYNVLVMVTPYSCWKNHMSTMGNQIVNWNTYQLSQGTSAHEFGHTQGLYHNAQRMPAYIEYGSGVDQMGSLSGSLLHILADHKQTLGVLTPLPCASATLHSIYQSPEAIRCGLYIMDYLADWGQVWVHKKEFTPSSGYGGSDTTDVAKLGAGQSYNMGAQTVTHLGQGRVVVQ